MARQPDILLAIPKLGASCLIDVRQSCQLDVLDLHRRFASGIACRDVLFKPAQSFTVAGAGSMQAAVVIDATGTWPVAIR
jgi:hypothetical protein